MSSQTTMGSNPKKAKQELQHPNWVFTLHFGGVGQITCEDAGVLIQNLEKYCSYLVVGKETAPTTGQQHMQGYCELLKPRRRTELVKVIQCFWDIAKGTTAQNFDYCSKGGDFYEVGEAKEQDPGKREQDRWELARTQAENGERVTDSQIVICHYQSIRALMRDHAPMPADAPDVTGEWFYGIAGAGKSRKARTENPGAYLKMCNKWWDGYDGQTAVIIDDFDASHAVLGHHLKIWADRYAFRAEIKGTAACIRPLKIIVTSQYSIDEIWSDTETREALHRRFKSTRIGPPSDAPKMIKDLATVPHFVIDDDTDDEHQEEIQFEEASPCATATTKPTTTCSSSGPPGSTAEAGTQATTTVSAIPRMTTTLSTPQPAPISVLSVTQPASLASQQGFPLQRSSELNSFLKEERAPPNWIKKTPN